jgi:hypothetical protein
MLEALEARDCPSPLAGPSNISLSVTYGTQKMVTLSGQVTNTDQPGGLTVQIAGSASGSVVTDANGNYSITLPVTQLGAVTATTTNGQSNTAQVTLVSQPPLITNFTWTVGAGGMTTFSGRVLDQSAPGLTVSFGGEPVSMQNQKVTVDADGWFHFSIKLNGAATDNGAVTAVVTDWWGLKSPVAQCFVQQP